MPKILGGKIIRDEIIKKLKSKVEGLKTKPVLAIIQVGDLEESNKYIKAKKSFGEKIGVEVRHIKFESTVLRNTLENEIETLNQDKTVHGIIVQLPLPKNLDAIQTTNLVDSEKDVDGLTENSSFMPATARGVLSLLDYYDIDVEWKKVTVMGRSNLVGLPIQMALTERGAEVSVVHSKTDNPKDITKAADILIVAIGKPKLVDDTYVKEGQILIDVGINSKDGKLVGDVDFDKVKDIVRAITPVPGGVGPLTVASLFQNLLEAYDRAIADINWENEVGPK